MVCMVLMFHVNLRRILIVLLMEYSVRSVRSNYLMVLFRSFITLNNFSLLVLSVIERGVWKSLNNIVVMSVSPLESINSASFFEAILKYILL